MKNKEVIVQCVYFRKLKQGKFSVGIRQMLFTNMHVKHAKRLPTDARESSSLEILKPPLDKTENVWLVQGISREKKCCIELHYRNVINKFLF